jgi:hypothetical protein
MAKKKTTKRKTAKGLLEAHPNLIWLVPALALAYILFAIIIR